MSHHCRAIPSVLITLHKTPFKWIKDLDIKRDTLNLIEEKVGNTLETKRQVPEQNINGSGSKRVWGKEWGCFRIKCGERKEREPEGQTK